MKHYKALRTALLIACASAISQAHALVVDFEVSDIGYIGTSVDGSFNGPYGPDPRSPSAGMFAGQFDPNSYYEDNYAYDAQAIFEFGLSNSPNYHAIKTATFSFDVTDMEQTNYFSGCFNYLGCPVPEQLNLYGFSGDGVVTTSDYNAGSLLATFDLGSLINTTIDVDVTGLTRALLSADNDFIGFNFRTTSGGGVYFPEATLTVAYSVPEPSSFALIALALAGIGIQRRAKSHDPRCDQGVGHT